MALSRVADVTRCTRAAGCHRPTAARLVGERRSPGLRRSEGQQQCQAQGQVQTHHVSILRFRSVGCGSRGRRGNDPLRQYPHRSPRLARALPFRVAVHPSHPLHDMDISILRMLRAGLDGDRTHVGTKSTGTDMVTEMDRASERLM